MKKAAFLAAFFFCLHIVKKMLMYFIDINKSVIDRFIQ